MTGLFPVVRSMHVSDRSTDFVAIGNFHISNNLTHAAFIINYQNTLKIFHFSGTEIKYADLNNDYYHKITETIVKDDVPAFIAHCLAIKSKANPIMGHFYSGESFDDQGNHISDSDLGQRMTCVGFCLNVLKGFLDEEYINYSQWGEDSHNEEGYLERYCEENDLNIDDVKNAHRRITPRECLASAFFTNLPIGREQIDLKVIELKEYFDSVFNVTVEGEE